MAQPTYQPSQSSLFSSVHLSAEYSTVVNKPHDSDPIINFISPKRFPLLSSWRIIFNHLAQWPPSCIIIRYI